MKRAKVIGTALCILPALVLLSACGGLSAADQKHGNGGSTAVNGNPTPLPTATPTPESNSALHATVGKVVNSAAPNASSHRVPAAPASSTAPTAAPAPTASANQSLIAIADSLGGPAGSDPFNWFTTVPTTVHFIRPDGTEVNSITLKTGIRVLTAAGPRIFVLEPGGVLKAVKADGSVEALGNLGSGEVMGLIASPDGTRWLWATADSALFSMDPTTGASRPIASSLHAGGIGLPPRVLEKANDAGRVLRPWRWTPAGPVIGKQTVCCQLGGGPMAFGDVYFGPDHFIDLDTGATRPLGTLANCVDRDIAADTSVACLANTLDVLSPTGTKVSVTIPLPPPSALGGIQAAGDVYFSSDGSRVALATANEVFDPSSTRVFDYETYVVDVKKGSVKQVSLAGVVPAMFELLRSSWLPDGSIVVLRQSGAPGGDSGIYVISPSEHVVKLSSGGMVLGVLGTPSQSTSPTAGAPTITSLVVANLNSAGGPYTGGTSVTISGTNYTPDAIVKFGNSYSSQVKWISSTQLIAVSPPSSFYATRGVDVQVLDDYGVSALNYPADWFQYFIPQIGALWAFMPKSSGGHLAEFCTAAVVTSTSLQTSNTILTAGHCVTPEGTSGELFTSFAFAPGFWGGCPTAPSNPTSAADFFKCKEANTPYGVWTGNQLGVGVDPDWLNNANPALDFAFIDVGNGNEDLKNQVGGALPIVFNAGGGPNAGQSWTLFSEAKTATIPTGVHDCTGGSMAVSDEDVPGLGLDGPDDLGEPDLLLVATPSCNGSDMPSGSSGGPWINDANGVVHGVGGVSKGEVPVNGQNPSAGVLGVYLGDAARAVFDGM